MRLGTHRPHQGRGLIAEPRNCRSVFAIVAERQGTLRFERRVDPLPNPTSAYAIPQCYVGDGFPTPIPCPLDGVTKRPKLHVQRWAATTAVILTGCCLLMLGCRSGSSMLRRPAWAILRPPNDRLEVLPWLKYLFWERALPHPPPVRQRPRLAGFISGTGPSMPSRGE